jgi:hypothetical protein
MRFNSSRSKLELIIAHLSMFCFDFVLIYFLTTIVISCSPPDLEKVSKCPHSPILHPQSSNNAIFPQSFPTKQQLTTCSLQLHIRSSSQDAVYIALEFYLWALQDTNCKIKFTHIRYNCKINVTHIRYNCKINVTHIRYNCKHKVTHIVRLRLLKSYTIVRLRLLASDELKD